jgi:hypothetical protein
MDAPLEATMAEAAAAIPTTLDAFLAWEER